MIWHYVFELTLLLAIYFLHKDNVKIYDAFYDKMHREQQRDLFNKIKRNRRDGN